MTAAPTALDPREIARQIECHRRPWWVVWYGRHTGCYWAMSSWVSGVHGMLSAPSPEALIAAIATFEMLHPKPSQQNVHALGH